MPSLHAKTCQALTPKALYLKEYGAFFMAHGIKDSLCAWRQVDLRAFSVTAPALPYLLHPCSRSHARTGIFLPVKRVTGQCPKRCVATVTPGCASPARASTCHRGTECTEIQALAYGAEGAIPEKPLCFTLFYALRTRVSLPRKRSLTRLQAAVERELHKMQ